MSRREGDVEAGVRAAAACSFAMIAYQIAGKAVRDAVFLSEFPITTLPRMVAGTSLLSIAAVLIASRVLTRAGPARALPIAWAASALVQLGLAALLPKAPRAVSVLLYLHVSVVGVVLVSWFWSMVNESLDPNTARRRMGFIALGGTLGGLLGGIAAERVGALFSTGSIVLLLAALHASCAALAFGVGRALSTGRPASPGPAPASGSARSGFRVLVEVPYLRSLGLFVMTGTVSAMLLDYVFKERASQAFTGDELVRFFGLFYTATSLATCLLQSTLTRALLGRGVAPTAATLPAFVAVGGAGALLVPGLLVTGIVRGLESAVRSSFFRSSYELFYTPVRRDDKRAAKTLVDVGFDRLGDAVGATIVQLVLLAGLAAAAPALIVIAIALGLAGLVVARALHRGYVRTLETSLLDQGGRPSSIEIDEASRSAYLRTIPTVEPGGPLPESVELAASAFLTISRPARPGPPGGAEPGEAVPAAPAASTDPIVRAATDLRSGHAARVRRALAALDVPPRELVPWIIPLLAWDAVAAEAVRVLRRGADRCVGQLLDSLLDTDEEFSIRRRVARVLGDSASPRAARGLTAALTDRRFEVRFQAGVSLARLHERHPDVATDEPAILTAVVREAAVNRQVWESNRLLDEMGREESPFYDEVLRMRSSRSLEHVFNLLSLVYPRRPLRIAYRGLHADDRALRGTALEYLEQILPPEIRESLWPFFDDDRDARGASRDMDSVMDSLLRSHESIQIHLEKLRREGP